MPTPRPSLAEWPHRCREWLAALPARWLAWRAALNEDPTLLWRTPVVRVLVVVVIGVAALLGVQWLISALTPAGPTGTFQQPTRTATLYVACTNADCLAHFTARQPMDFRAWPLACPECGQPTAYRASVCKACGQWFAVPPEGPPGCPHCAARRNAERPRRPTSDRTGSPDDDEDPW